MPEYMPQTRIWLIALAVFSALLWLLKPMLLPFVAGLAIAYFLNPVVDGLTRRRIPRWLGTLFVLLGFVSLVALLLLLLAPLLQDQISALISALPGYLVTLRAHLIPWAQHVAAKLSPGNVERLQAAAGQLAGSAAGWAGDVLKGLISEGAALFNVLALLVVTPVVAFFLLRDWPRLAEHVDAMLPRKHYELIRATLRDIDRALSGFVRGQALVCLSLGFIYSIGLSLVGLKYGVTIGLIAGVLSFVPYVGSTFMLVSSLLLAIVQFDTAVPIFLVFLVFLIGQSLEGYVLTPKLVGDRIGLHPVWIIFALFAGGSLLGFVGVLIAVPVAAIAGVLVRLAFRLYQRSPLYHDQKPEP
jgi:predicted PurR-regulated permease PerM